MLHMYLYCRCSVYMSDFDVSEDSLQAKLHSAHAKLALARYGVPASAWRLSVSGTLRTVDIKTGDGVRACQLDGTDFKLLPHETVQEFRFSTHGELNTVECKLEAKCKDWVEVWQGSVKCTARQSAWIPFPRRKTPQFRYFKLDDAASTTALQSREWSATRALFLSVKLFLSVCVQLVFSCILLIKYKK